MPDATRLCRSLLAVVDAIPSTTDRHVVALSDHPRWLFIADTRPEATTIERDAIVGQFGTIIADECLHSARDASAIIGSIVEIPEGADQTEAAERLRGAYHLATEPIGDGDDDQPF
ncbi:hypothetical protein K227x_27390 [Rubripirellula lacrimiformis]|uniref:Uncharacterized protein n=1 Tax=Rubripirellula lacrimiformis TaxID=1930273 RepID=A0A517NBE7_9BACT|nr:hypothetical protein [Rubripirellula lacrimiformis]QDT04348.1 hypothetical protein K227x_27390 [Rubripirellula lacrimiformis]